MAVVAALVVAVTLALALHLLLAYLKSRRQELAIPGPPSLPVLGNTLDFLGCTKETILTTVLRLWDKHHDVPWRISLFGHLMVFVSDPDHLQEVFAKKSLLSKAPFAYRFFNIFGVGSINLNGLQWRAHRRVLQPAFHQRVLDGYTSVFAVEARRFVRWVRPGEPLDVMEGLESLVVRNFLWTAIVPVGREDEVERLVPDFQDLLKTFAQSFLHRLVQPWLWPDWVYLRLSSTGRKIRRLTKSVDASFMELIAAKRAQLKLQRPEDTVDDKYRTLLDILLEPGDHLSLTDAEILDELKIFGGAATDTTAATLSWTLKVLSVRPDVQERLLQEVLEVVGKDTDSLITPSHLERLEYTERVIKETMRLLTPVGQLGRHVQEETTIGGYTVPAGSTLALNVLGAHRDPRHWPDPMKFDPDRFLPENSVGRHPYAYLPFSQGPRNCIGGQYAMMDMKMLLATLVPRYRINPINDGFKEPADFPMASGLYSWMVGGVRVVFTPRADCATIARPC